ncbi:hypothetical protein Q31a_24390 [Aureliella helgolandensis]|uniref:Uncharacterized protein n=1 Tax=Aureliella helgolandensis TaxID=2527968 RepID=A0A518G6A6_9BACT|nr:hypothetical protein Q31a_24390 [Aureliella helgolandensis]
MQPELAPQAILPPNCSNRCNLPSSSASKWVLNARVSLGVTKGVYFQDDLRQPIRVMLR